MRNVIEKLLFEYKDSIDRFFNIILKKDEFTTSLEKAVNLMKNRFVVCTGMGKSGYIAEKMSSTLRSLGIRSCFIHPAEASHGDMGLLDKNTVLFAISKSGESKELKDIITFCNDEEISVISITMKKNNFLSDNSDVNINFHISDEICKEGLAPTVSTTISLIICDIIAIALSIENGFTRDIFKKYHPGGKLGFYLLKVENVMRNLADSPIVNSGTKIVDSLFEITSKGCGLVMIANQGKLRGVLTDGDIRRNIEKVGIQFLNEPIDNYMTKKPKITSYDKTVKELLEYMLENSVNVVPVVDEHNNIKGIVHIRDLANLLK